MQITPRGLLKLIGGIVATILLGAIGSGVWERVLSPALNWFYRVSINIVTSISAGYKDGIYKAASFGFHETYSLKVFAIVSLLISLSIIIWILKHTLTRLGVWDNVITRKLINRFLLIASFSFVILVYFSLNKHEAINNTVTYSTRSLDILRPYVGDQEYRKMLSDFYQIRTASQFYSFNQKLITLAKSKGLTLPDFNPL